MRRFSFLSVLFAAAFTLLLSGCGDDDTVQPPVERYVDPTSEMNVLKNLEASWECKDTAQYASLLADDFRFYFDKTTRILDNLPLFWTRVEDSTGSGRLFAAPITRSIQVALRQTQEPDTLTGPGQEGWTQVNVLNTFLEVEMDPTPENPEGLTRLVEGQIHHFYFRRGRTPDDTLASSPTSDRYYIVKWVDEGESYKPGTPAPRPAAASEGSTVGMMTTWGSIKAMFR